MKHTTLLAGVLLALSAPAAAQWSDNFESYAANQVLSNVGGWFGWDNVPAAAATVDASRSRSFPNSLRVGGTTDAVHPQIGAVSGKWTMTAWQYIPSPQAGDLYVILNNVYNHGGPYNWTTELQADITTGMVIDDLRPHTPVPIVLNQWAEYRLEIDLDANTIASFYNGSQISSGTYAATGPRAIANIDLFSTGGVCNFDDITLQWKGEAFETYAAAQVLSNVGGWFGWDNVPAAAASVDGTRARSAPNSLLVGGTTDAVHPQIGITRGRWTMTAWQYIPSPQAGDLYFILNNVYSHGGPYNWSTELQADITTGMVIDDLRPHTPVPIVFNTWVEYRLDIDLDANTIASHYNGVQISRGTYAATGPRAIANIDLFSTGGACNWDDIRFQEASTAPCYETNIGTALALGDDQTVDRPLGFAFPFPGGSTTDVGICSNGFVWLAAGQPSSDFSPTVLEFLGSVQATPRLAPCWRDFNPGAAGSDDVYFNTFPGRAVITWHNVVRFGGTSPMTMQLQMLSDGSYYVFFDANFDIVAGGLIPGVKTAVGVVADPGSTDFSVALPVSTTVPAVYELFASAATFDMRGRCMRFVPNATGGYAISFRNDCGAVASPYGAGCPTGTPVTLAASAPPYLGTTFNLNVTNVPALADAGAMLLGVSTANISLTPIGLVGCSVYTSMDVAVGLPLTPPTGTLAVPVPLWPGLIGLVLNTQAAVVTNTGPVTTNTSNGLALVFGKN